MTYTCKYDYVYLYKGKHSSRYRLHRLIAETFIPNPAKRPQVNHKNGVKTDNRVENLEWCTAQQNITHAIETGLKNQKGENSCKHILTEKQVKEIRALYRPRKKGASANDLAKRFGVSSAAISKIIAGVNWKVT